MELVYYRQSFATNSSSDHNAIMLPGGHPDVYPPGMEASAQAYLSDWFVLGSREAKLAWLAQCARPKFAQQLGEEAAGLLLERALGLERVAVEGGVDHQSVPVLPHRFSQAVPDLGYLQELARLLLREDSVILGGFAQDDEPADEYRAQVQRLRAQATRQLVLSVGKDEGGWVCRAEAGYWVLFNRRTGRKARVRFGAAGATALTLTRLPRPRTPELVDVKITDFCVSGCRFCYQGSSPQGAHAELAAVQDLARDCAAAEVFEVSLGGGEPTRHPHFMEILRTFRAAGVVPNFTTSTLDWVLSPPGPEILELCGGFAYSVQADWQVEQLRHVYWLTRNAAQRPASALLPYRHSLARPTANVILGLDSLTDTLSRLRLLTQAGIPITLLGWKEPPERKPGTPKPRSYRGWVKRVGKVLAGQMIGLDTQLAANSAEELAQAGVPAWLYETQEGQASLYVDLVQGKFGSCSYTPELREYRRLRPAWAELGDEASTATAGGSSGAEDE